MKHYLFSVKKGATVGQAMEELGGLLADIYEVEDAGGIQIGGYAEEMGDQFIHVELVAVTDGIDWEKQWSAFAPGFHDGVAHIELSNGQMMQLKPGGGFGDLSHPTTRMVLSMMEPYVRDSVVFDVGCGSGILGIAAALLGAKKIYGIDIESTAVEHARENAALNGVDAEFSKEVDREWVTGSCLILMNMIEVEQRAAWEAQSILHGQNAMIVTSGILVEQREEYLARVKSWNWVLEKEVEEEGWLGFIFRQEGL